MSGKVPDNCWRPGRAEMELRPAKPFHVPLHELPKRIRQAASLCRLKAR